MTHPEELLAGYVDGTLSDPERGVVDAHLAACATCREETDLARTALAALATLEEVPVPFGVTGPVLGQAGRSFEQRRRSWQRFQWAAGLAAAAGLVLVFAVNLGNGGEEPSTLADGAGAPGATEAPAATGALEAAQVPPPALERQVDVSYDDAGVRSLAADAARAVQRGTGSDATLAAPEESDAALRCLRRSGAPLDDPADLLVRLIEAEYEGTPAYFAVFLEGPGAGQPPDRAVVWVTAVDGCSNLHFNSLRI